MHDEKDFLEQQLMSIRANRPIDVAATSKPQFSFVEGLEERCEILVILPERPDFASQGLMVQTTRSWVAILPPLVGGVHFQRRSVPSSPPTSTLFDVTYFKADEPVLRELLSMRLE
jgi:hypothetical protein